jgi:predicted transcriptional regulator
MANRILKAGDLITLKSSLLDFYNGKDAPIYLVTKTTRIRTRPSALVDIQRLGSDFILKGIESDIYEVYNESR